MWTLHRRSKNGFVTTKDRYYEERDCLQQRTNQKQTDSYLRAALLTDIRDKI
jgi:hypothetical protein